MERFFLPSSFLSLSDTEKSNVGGDVGGEVKRGNGYGRDGKILCLLANIGQVHFVER